MVEAWSDEDCFLFEWWVKLVVSMMEDARDMADAGGISLVGAELVLEIPADADGWRFGVQFAPPSDKSDDSNGSDGNVKKAFAYEPESRFPIAKGLPRGPREIQAP